MLLLFLLFYFTSFYEFGRLGEFCCIVFLLVAWKLLLIFLGNPNFFFTNHFFIEIKTHMIKDIHNLNISIYVFKLPLSVSKHQLYMPVFTLNQTRSLGIHASLFPAAPLPHRPLICHVIISWVFTLGTKII